MDTGDEAKEEARQDDVKGILLLFIELSLHLIEYLPQRGVVVIKLHEKSASMEQ